MTVYDTSNSFNLSIEEAPSTVLATAAAGMSSGDWLQLTGSDLPSGLDLFSFQGGSSGIATHFATNMAYDSSAKKMYWLGCDHGDDTLFLVYDEATNAWSEQATSVPWGIEAGGTTAHGYNHTVWTPGQLWHRPYSALNIRRWDGGTSWGTVDYSGVAFYSQAANGCAFHPNFGTNGSILIFQLESGTVGALFKVDPVTEAVSVIVSTGAGTLDPVGDPHLFNVYNPTSDVCFFGGGASVDTCWTINASGTVTAKASISSGLGDVGPATGYSRIWANPSNGNFIAIKDSSTWYDFSVSCDSWTSRGGTVTMLSSNTYNGTVDGVIGESLPDYGVLVFVKAYSGSSNAEMWLFKP